jgi:hypothetical protein
MGRIFYRFDLLARTSGSFAPSAFLADALRGFSHQSFFRRLFELQGSFLVKTRDDVSVIASPKPGGPTRSSSSPRMAFQESRVRHWLARDFECFVRETP